MADPEDLEDVRNLRAMCARREPECGKAFGAIERRYARKFRSFFKQWRKNSEDVNEICQETLLKVFERACKFSATGKASAWVWTIARNTLIDWPRDQPRPDRPPDDGSEERDPIEQLPDPNWDPATLENRNHASLAMAILRRFDPRYHDAVFFRVVLEEDYDVVAGIVGLSQRSARQFVSDAMKALDLVVIALEEGKPPSHIHSELRAAKSAPTGAKP